MYVKNCRRWELDEMRRKGSQNALNFSTFSSIFPFPLLSLSLHLNIGNFFQNNRSHKHNLVPHATLSNYNTHSITVFEYYTYITVTVFELKTIDTNHPSFLFISFPIAQCIFLQKDESN